MDQEKKLALSVIHTSETDVKKLVGLGFKDKGVKCSRHRFIAPQELNVVETDGYTNHIFELSEKVKFVIKRKPWHCSEYHWDEYDGGDYSLVIWPNDPYWDKPQLAPSPPTKELTDEMIQQRKQAEIDWQRRVKEARDYLEQQGERLDSIIEVRGPMPVRQSCGICKRKCHFGETRRGYCVKDGFVRTEKDRKRFLASVTLMQDERRKYTEQEAECEIEIKIKQ